MAPLANPVLLGVVGAAHGIKGEVRIKSFTQDPLDLDAYGPLRTAQGTVLTIQSLRLSKTVVIARLKEIQDRNAAEALNGVELFVDRSMFPQDLEEEEFYHSDLVGLTCIDAQGETLGSVIAIHNYGAGDMLEMRPTTGRVVMIPFTQAAVPEIDIKRGVISIDRDAAGLNTDNDAADKRAEDEAGRGTSS